MKYRVSFNVDAPNANGALSILYQMTFFADADIDDVGVELVEVPTREDIKFLAEQSSIGDLQALKEVAEELRYPHIDELVKYMQEKDGPDCD